MMNEQYYSVLGTLMKEFVAQKRANGFSYKGEAQMLMRFDRLCIDQQLKDIAITKEIVDLWSEKAYNENLNTRYHRISDLRQFCIYLVSQGFEAYIPKLIASGEKSIPYILSHEELIALFKVIDNQIPNYKHPLKFVEGEKILYRLFYCCGLRRSEGCNLKMECVDLINGEITIFHSKGDKDRVVYLPDDLLRMCQAYIEFINKECPGSPWLFPGKDPMNHYSNAQLDVNFKKFWEKTPYAQKGNKYPTIHSLRHTFVVDKMNEWMEKEIDLKSMLPYLSRYLGHSSVNDTLYYYHLVDKAFQNVRSKDTHFNDLIPEVETYEN